jgi:hypothetical protein
MEQALQLLEDLCVVNWRSASSQSTPSPWDVPRACSCLSHLPTHLGIFQPWDRGHQPMIFRDTLEWSEDSLMVSSKENWVRIQKVQEWSVSRKLHILSAGGTQVWGSGSMAEGLASGRWSWPLHLGALPPTITPNPSPGGDSGPAKQGWTLNCYTNAHRSVLTLLSKSWLQKVQESSRWTLALVHLPKGAATPCQRGTTWHQTPTAVHALQPLPLGAIWANRLCG